MTESSKGDKHTSPSTSVTTERNRLMSWESTVQGLAKPGAAATRSKSSINPWTLGFVSKITKLFFASLAKLPYTLFKFSYEIAKLFTRGLSRIKCRLSGSKEARARAAVRSESPVE